MNNNCDLDNGVYNKFVNQSSSSENGEETSNDEEDSDDQRQRSAAKMINQQVRMFDSNDYQDLPNDEADDEQNSLVTSMNGG